MRVFLAGASGVIGQRLIPRLVRAGHVVGGMTRSSGKTEALRRLGAVPILCDVFDREALIQAMRIHIDRAAERTVEALHEPTGVVVIVDSSHAGRIKSSVNFAG